MYIDLTNPQQSTRLCIYKIFTSMSVTSLKRITSKMLMISYAFLFELN